MKRSSKGLLMLMILSDGLINNTDGLGVLVWSNDERRELLIGPALRAQPSLEISMYELQYAR